MSRLEHPDLVSAHADWIAAGRPIPLEVSLSRYDDVTLSWEVLYIDTPWNGYGGCSTPIAEFTTWQEAQDYATAQAATSPMRCYSRETLGPITEYESARRDAWAAYEAGTGPHPFTTDLERMLTLTEGRGNG